MGESGRRRDQGVNGLPQRPFVRLVQRMDQGEDPLGLFFHGWSGLGLGTNRHSNREGRAFAVVAFGLDAALMGLDDGLYDEKPQARSLDLGRSLQAPELRE